MAKGNDNAIIWIVAIIGVILIYAISQGAFKPVVNQYSDDNANNANQNQNNQQQTPSPTCVDSDNGKISTTAGVCKSSSSLTYYSDSCHDTSNVLEYFCGGDLICHSELTHCPVDWVCITNKCIPKCQEGIINPASQGQCNIGYCGIGEGDCTYVPEENRCGCSGI